MKRAASLLLLPALLGFNCSGDPVASTCPLGKPPLCKPGAPPVNCADLGALWTTGTASCRADCSGYDVSSCGVNDDVKAGQWEVVRPYSRASDSQNQVELPEGAGSMLCNRAYQSGTDSWQGADFAVSRRSPSSDKWVIYLEGGGFCGDEATCQSRGDQKSFLVEPWPKPDRTLVTLTDIEPGMLGILAAKKTFNPNFFGDNKVFGNYCSSDFWSGTAASRQVGQESWAFNGLPNLLVLIDTLKQRYGLDDTDPATQVLLVGGSAGALGVYASSHLVAARLPATAAAGRLRVVVDGGYIPYDWDIYGTSDTTDSVLHGAWQWWSGGGPPSLHPGCQAAASGDEWSCYTGRRATRHLAAGGAGAVALPTLLVTHQLDTTQADFGGVVTTPGNQAQIVPGAEAKADEWAQGIRDSIDLASHQDYAPSAWVWSTCGLESNPGSLAHVQIHRQDWITNSLPYTGSCAAASAGELTLAELVHCFADVGGTPSRLQQTGCPDWTP